MKVVVTGASGFLGSYVTAELTRREHIVLAWSHRQAQGHWAIDLTETQIVEAKLETTKPDGIINLAGISQVQTCKENPNLAQQLNSRVPGELADLAARKRLRLIHVSTELVFDGSHRKLREEDSPCPRNLYGESKLQGEKEVIKKNQEATIIRPSLITGEAPSGRISSTSWLLRALKSGQQPKMFTDEIRTPVAALDVARVLVDLVEMPDAGGLFHCGGGEEITRYALACREAKAAGMDTSQIIPATREELGLAAERPEKLALDSSRIIRKLGWIPKT